MFISSSSEMLPSMWSCAGLGNPAGTQKLKNGSAIVVGAAGPNMWTGMVQTS